MRPSSFGDRICRWSLVLAVTMLVSSGCKTETSPTFNGVTTDTLFTVEGGDVILDVKKITPAAVATSPATNPGSIEFALTCKFPNSGIRWGWYYLREDGVGAVFQSVGCPQSFLQAKQSFGVKNTIEYDFIQGHTARLRLAVAANADALMNGGPYIYLGTRDIVTWTFQ